MIANNGHIATHFAETGINTMGTLTRASRAIPVFTKNRIKAETTLLNMAKETGQPVGRIISKVVSQSIPELQSYVGARGEAPSENPSTLAVQAALLRAMEIATTAKAIDTDDADALVLLEQAEDQAIQDNASDASHVLRPDTSAAIDLLVRRISERYKARGGSGRLADFVIDLKKQTGADNFDNISVASIAEKCCSFPNNAGDGFIFYTPEQKAEVTGTATAKTSFWDNLFNNIDKAVDAITKVTNAVNTTTQQTSGTIGEVLGRVEDVGGNIGASSIEKYLASNWWKVALFIVGAIFITIILIRASKSK